MSIQFTVNETPRPKGRKGAVTQHARQLSEGTYKLDYICELIGARSAVSSAEVKSVLDSFAWVMELAFSAGYHLELADLGYFSPSLRTLAKDEKKATVLIDGVNFRCSRDLMEKMKKIQLKQVKVKQNQDSMEIRRKKMIEYIERNEVISPRQYALHIGCTRYRAETDIRTFVEDGTLLKIGYRSKTVYVLKGED